MSLINPEKPIQPFVVNLTGINNKMLRNAPKFHEVAKRIVEITEGCVLVAHNTSFDYRIMRTEFRRLGYEYERNTLCTVALSKKLFPNFEKYKLDVICKNLGIPVSNRHRAEGDAFATVKLFEMLLHKDVDKIMLKNTLKPIENFKISDRLIRLLADLPTELGIFYLHDSNGKILYIDKHKNIKQGVTNLFLREAKKIRKLVSLTKSISFELLGNDLIASLKMYRERTVHKPKFNAYKKHNYKPVSFSNENMIILLKGRNLEEKSVVVIENNQYVGNTFVALNHQINQPEILHNLITRETLDNHNNNLVNNYLKNNKVEKIIRL